MSTFGLSSRLTDKMKHEMNRQNKYKEQTSRKRELEDVVQHFVDRIRRDDAVSATEADASFEEVMHRVRTDKAPRRKNIRLILWSVASAAAVLALLWGGYHWMQHVQPVEPIELDASLLSRVEHDAPLDRIVLHTGSQKFFLNDDVAVTYNKEGTVAVDKVKLQEDASAEKGGQDLNCLSVPHGTHAAVTLSDGTRIYVNAGSKLIYPRKFQGKRREVLLEGEAYLEVARNEESPFVVKTNGMDVRVLGTKFNVQAYRDADDVSVVLAQGSVEVDIAGTGNNKVMLTPNERFVKDRQGIRVDEVDVAEYISWKDNVLLVKGKPVGDIFRQLERFYGCRIHVDPKTSKRLLSGKLELAPSVREVVENICLSLSLSYQYISEKEINIETIN